eukprot:CAMPEP_0203756002 /NCGR_PEP_ID=MMETSP0098-20131031/9327_1 /ASSEMBLY_ACC=CAM_ASM_000208 /TAXON_ID=96639 /ORGANISM=" , Strain NY0313808BC1" /LENGTH=323 /DNA_ID=CAMNT_0050647665 /DNA_START=95 /DNA_END=1063 /DNA_ORIENTATION=+
MVNVKLSFVLAVFNWINLGGYIVRSADCLKKEYQYKASTIRSDGSGDETTQDEISGIAVSSTNVVNNEKVIWVISDSGSPHVVAFGINSGKRLASVNIEEAIWNWSKDWEGLNIGPCDRGTCLYVMDTGNNAARNGHGHGGRNSRYVYRFEEPKLPKEISSVKRYKLPKDDVDVIKYRYDQDGISTADSEASFLDPLNQDLYIITKWNSEDHWRTRMFRIPGGTKHASILNLKPLSNPTSKLKSNTWSRGDMSKDGKMIVLGAYGKAYFWKRLPGESVEQAMSRDSCYKLYVPPSGYQHESIAFGATPDKIYQVSEGYNPDLW